MPRYERLDIDVDAEPWSLAAEASLPPEGALPSPDSPPLPILVDGRTPASLMTAPRGFGLDFTTDVVASPELCELLGAFALPAHTSFACVSELLAFDLRTMCKRKKEKGRPFRWFQWSETFARRIDFARSTFFVRSRDGTTEEVAYEALEDWSQVVRRAATTLAFDVAPATLEWGDAAVYALDLLPLGLDLFLSPSLAERLRTAALPGIRLLPPRRTASVVA